jgi:hypothetical protein
MKSEGDVVWTVCTLVRNSGRSRLLSMTCPVDSADPMNRIESIEDRYTSKYEHNNNKYILKPEIV